LSEDKIARLNLISGWSWNPIDDRWELGFNLTLAFGEKYGYARPPEGNAVDGFRLGSWANSQRIDYKDGTLSKDRAERLESLDGWSWIPKTDKTDELLQRLNEFAALNGHCDIPTTEDNNLCLYVRRCRTRYASNTLDEQLRRKLEQIPSWTWAASDKVDALRGNDSLTVSLLYQLEKETGIPHLSKTQLFHGQPLGRWLVNLRQRFFRGQLDVNLIKQIEAVPGWNWKVNETYWTYFFQDIQRYTKLHGDLLIPYRSDLSDSSKSWINRQRLLKRQGRLDSSKAELLEKLPGWSWEPLTNLSPWMKKYDLVKNFMMREKTSIIPKGHLEDGIRISSWVGYQRRLHREQNLTLEKIRLLELIPYWTWESPFDTTNGKMASSK